MLNLIKKLYQEYFDFRHKHFVSQINHGNILSTINQPASLYPRYVFFIIISMTFATLGLLINSSTFLLGAMLLFPLMFAMNSLGFALCTLNFLELKRSSILILTGIFVSISTAYLIVKISPLSEPNDLILSKTNPNLFDLIVALAAGLVAGYSNIRSRGKEASAVAIAGSLSPPLAAVGFGFAINDYTVSFGAFYLFITNLVTMTLSIALIAKWYGFGIKNNTSFVLWQALVTLSVFIALSVPLAISMQKIAKAAYIQNLAEKIIKNVIGEESTLTNLNVLFPKDENSRPLIKAVVITNMDSNKLATKITELLASTYQIEGEVQIYKISAKVTNRYLSHLKPHKSH